MPKVQRKIQPKVQNSSQESAILIPESDEERYSRKNFTTWQEKKRFQMMQEFQIFKTHPSNFSAKTSSVNAKSAEISVKAERTEEEMAPHVVRQTAPLQSVGTVHAENFKPYPQFKQIVLRNYYITNNQ